MLETVNRTFALSCGAVQAFQSWLGSILNGSWYLDSSGEEHFSQSSTATLG
jgi:hypothetical protein